RQRVERIERTERHRHHVGDVVRGRLILTDQDAPDMLCVAPTDQRRTHAVEEARLASTVATDHHMDVCWWLCMRGHLEVQHVMRIAVTHRPVIVEGVRREWWQAKRQAVEATGHGCC